MYGVLWPQLCIPWVRSHSQTGTPGEVLGGWMIRRFVFLMEPLHCSLVAGVFVISEVELGGTHKNRQAASASIKTGPRARILRASNCPCMEEALDRFCSAE